MCSRAFRPFGLPIYVARVPAAPFSLLPSSLYVDHSHCLVLAPATLAALPSTRAIETRSLPTSLAAIHRGFAFHVAFPKSSIPSIATCSISEIPFLDSWLTSRVGHRTRGHCALSAMLTVLQLSKSFAGRALFDDLSLQVNRGDLIKFQSPDPLTVRSAAFTFLPYG